MHGLIADGHAVDIVLLVIAGEAFWLWRGRRWSGRALICRLMPGVMMMIALRAALTGQHWVWIALALALSFPFHLADLWLGPGARTKE
ncbi:MAG: hypothetical protein K2P79_10110 [Sphingomonas sp.]|nr:hypothetical protein [Sphingomonas sp.]